MTPMTPVGNTAHCSLLTIVTMQHCICVCLCLEYRQGKEFEWVFLLESVDLRTAFYKSKGTKMVG